MGKADKTWIILAVILVAVGYFLNAFGMYDTLCGNYNLCLGSTSTPVVDDGDGNGAEKICIYDGVTMTIGPMKEKWNPATVVSNRGARVFVNGVDRGVYADSATMDVNYGDEVVIFYAENDTEGSIGYYTARSEFKVPCTSAFSSADQDDMEQLYAFEGSSNALGFKVFCEDDGLLNAIGTTEDIASGDVISLEFSLQPTFEDAWSPYCRGIVVVDGNGTAYDEVVFNGWDKAPVPSMHRTNATSYEEWAYYVPPLVPVAGAYPATKGTITVDASSSGAFAGSKQLTMNVTWYDCDWYRHSNTGEMLQGVENDAGTNVGGTNYKDNIWMT